MTKYMSRVCKRGIQVVCAAALGSSAACIAPTTQLGTIAPELVAAEQLKQQQLVIQSEIAEQKRLVDIAYPMVRAAVPLCGKYIMTRTGVTVSNIQAYRKEYVEAARAFGLTDTLVVTAVAAGSAAEKAGIRVSDRLLTVSGAPAPMGKNATTAFANLVAPRPTDRNVPALASAPLQFTVGRAATEADSSRELAVSIAQDTVCAYGALAQKDEMLNAWADGSQVVVTTAMMRFAGTDDELAIIVAHEIAHNAMRHIDAKQSNATVGAIFGALVDIAFATQGVNTYGDFSNSGAAIGAQTFSQDFEREADYVGMYVLARAGRPFDAAANFWRRMAQESPGSIKYASTHPTSAERFIRLEEFAAEIKKKQQGGEALLPSVKSKP